MTALDVIFSSIADTSWRASCLILLVLGVRCCARRHVAARLLFWAWLAVALRLLLPVSVPVAWSPFNLTAWRHPSSDAPSLESARETPRPMAAPAPPAASQESARHSAPSFIMALSAGQWAAVIWCGGAVVLLVARASACSGFSRRVRRSAGPAPAGSLPADVVRALDARGVKLLVTDAVCAPALHGIVRPRILFPPGFLERLSPAEIRLTIAHELAHAERRDLLADAILHLAVVVHWFNPLVWLAARTARQDCELACDEFVVRRATEMERECYGATILRIASLTSKAPRPGFGLGVVASKRQIKRRIQMILANHAFTLSGTLLSGAVFAAITGLSFTSEVTAQVAPPGAESPSAAPAPGAVAARIVYNADVDRLDHLFPAGIVATVNDRSITVADVRGHIAHLIPLLQRDARNQDEFNGRLTLLQNSAIKDLVNRAVLIRQFHDTRSGEQPRQISEEHIDTAMVDELNERFGGDRSKFLDHLRGRSMTLSDYRKEVEEHIIYNYMRSQERRIAGKTNAPKSDPAEKPIRLRIIQLSRSEGQTDASLLEKAHVILARFRSGDTFENLAREFDQSVRRDRGGDWGWQGPVDVKPLFRDTLLALKKGEVSAPIVVDEGCFLLYAEDRR